MREAVSVEDRFQGRIGVRSVRGGGCGRQVSGAERCDRRRVWQTGSRGKRVYEKAGMIDRGAEVRAADGKRWA